MIKNSGFLYFFSCMFPIRVEYPAAPTVVPFFVCAVISIQKWALRSQSQFGLRNCQKRASQKHSENNFQGGEKSTINVTRHHLFLKKNTPHTLAFFFAPWKEKLYLKERDHDPFLSSMCHKYVAEMPYKPRPLLLMGSGSSEDEDEKKAHSGAKDSK